MCHRVDRKIITDPIQTTATTATAATIATDKSLHMHQQPLPLPPLSSSPRTTNEEKKNFVQLLVQRVRIKLLNYRSDRDTIDAVTTTANFDYRFDRNFEMRPNHNFSHHEEKSQVRNWRYHLTNDHF